MIPQIVDSWRTDTAWLNRYAMPARGTFTDLERGMGPLQDGDRGTAILLNTLARHNVITIEQVAAIPDEGVQSFRRLVGVGPVTRTRWTALVTWARTLYPEASEWYREWWAGRERAAMEERRVELAEEKVKLEDRLVEIDTELAKVSVINAPPPNQENTVA